MSDFDSGFKLALEINDIKLALANHQEHLKFILDRLDLLEKKHNGNTDTNTTDTARR